MISYVAKRVFDGFLLLLPLILSYLLIGALFELLMVLTVPITDLLPGDFLSGEWSDPIVAAALLLLLCFVFGLADRTETFRRAMDWMEERILRRFAPYSVLKDFSRRLSGSDVPEKLHPALLSTGDGARMLVFIVEEHANDQLTLFVPFASMPGIGHIQIVPAARVEKLDASMMDTLGALFNWGDGTEALLSRKSKG